MFTAVTLFFFDWTHIMLATARDEAALVKQTVQEPSQTSTPAEALSEADGPAEAAADAETAPVETAPVETAPVETAPVETAGPSGAAELENLTVEKVSWLERIQFVPALKGHGDWIVWTILVVSLLFGRLYCSVICPLGILQDLIAWVSRRVHRGKAYEYKKPLPILRWLFVLLAFGGTLMGYSLLLNIVEPYSIFGRIANAVFRPVYVLLNNTCLVSDSASGTMAFSTIAMSNVFLSLGAFVTALATFLIIAVLAWRGGRTWCNTVCPIGTILGLLSKFSFFRVRIDPGKCKSCGMCAAKCKSSCMDTEGKIVDASRCVTCFNCLGTCQFDALTYTIGNPLRLRSAVSAEDQAILDAAEEKKKAALESLPEEKRLEIEQKNEQKKQEKAEEAKARARRDFLITAGSMAASVPVVAGAAAVVNKTVMVKPEPDKVYRTGQHAWTRKNPVAPPGAGSYKRLMKHCTGCHLCIAKCPQHVLKPAFMEYGLQGMFLPVMDFSSSFCNYDCTICAEVCPNKAISILRMVKERGETIPETAPERAEAMRKEKNYVQMGKVVFVKENCVVPVDGTFCGACDEHCPTKAVSMVPYSDPSRGIGPEKGLTIPQIDESICIGCGGCESICPARPYKAIYVEGCSEQGHREEFKEAEVISAEEIQKETENVEDWLFN
ncbi:MAG: 4Fe-4S dicluster domain-containing protein [Planctomycetaceae bacterium]|nr:4Fe-4S dicluster domain-containing protein [Planctomycetaceae bacterium]